jgi:hypothetical protein
MEVLTYIFILKLPSSIILCVLRAVKLSKQLYVIRLSLLINKLNLSSNLIIQKLCAY